MVGLQTYIPDPDPRLRALGTERRAVPFSTFLGAIAGDTWSGSAGPLTERALSRAGAQQLENEMLGLPGIPTELGLPMGEAGGLDDGPGVLRIPTGPPPGVAPPAPSPRLPPEELNARFGIDGHLRFDAPATEAYAADLRRLKLEELRRRDIIARSGRSALNPAAVAVALGVSVLDPLNVAASFLPVVGQARYGAMLAAAGGAARRAGIRAGVGAVEGLAGAALLEPLAYGLSAAEQRDYSAADSFFNLAFGTALGGGLHVGAGAVRDLAFGPPRVPRPVQAQAIDQAAAQIAAGEPIQPVPGTSLDAAFQANLRGIAEAQARAEAVAVDRAARAEASLEPIAARPIGEPAAAFLPTGEELQVQLALVELDDLVTSHSDDFTLDPRFPEALQPRDRGRAEMQAQVIDMAANLEPRRLGNDAGLDQGAPLVAADGTVESGNGRTMAIRRAYRMGGAQAEAYRAWLKAQGYDAEGMAAPVLVRVRRTPLDLEGRARLGRQANRTAIAAHDATEQGRADAGVLASQPDALRATSGRSLDAADQAMAATALLRTIASDAEMTGLTTGGRTINAAGRSRLAAAVRGYAWAPLIRALTGDAGELQGLADALGEAALPWARLRAAVAQGIVPAELDITDALVKAVDVIARARAEGQKVGDLVAQLDLFEAPLITSALKILFQDAGFTRVRGKGQIADLLEAYAEEAARFRAGEADLFGPPPTPDQVLDAVRGKRSTTEAAAGGAGEPPRPPPEAPPAAAEPPPEDGARQFKAPDGTVLATVRRGEHRHPDTGEDLIDALARGAAMPPTNTIDTAERQALRQQVEDALMARDTPEDGRILDIVMGPPGAGKSTFVDPLKARRKARVVDSDDAKAELPEFEGGIGANAVHAESAAIASRMLTRAIEAGDNIVYPTVGRDADALLRLAERATAAGYSVRLHLVDLGEAETLRRVLVRFDETGRMVDPDYVAAVASLPRDVFGRIYGAEVFDGWSRSDNNVARGEAPRTLDRGGLERPAGGRDGPGTDPDGDRHGGPGPAGSGGRGGAAQALPGGDARPGDGGTGTDRLPRLAGPAGRGAGDPGGRVGPPPDPEAPEAYRQLEQLAQLDELRELEADIAAIEASLRAEAGEMPGVQDALDAIKAADDKAGAADAALSAAAACLLPRAPGGAA
ncbi:zeta toxin family protein [Zavarzinia sp. CC-PAN008]|uniref:zeta toxin family protein n=1 Tax=Zavarzinia sp. CC-PAN008 TaxID=3243332 RepID=UPI003F746283